ncbi:MAG TPA: glycosyl hydrolase [Longimicrobiales bacterium]|nr:glycosyl hydrolase [Longimicrobiales bacterium]
MRRRYRVLVSAIVALASIGLVVLLIVAGTATLGPVGAALESIGGAVSRLETRTAHRLRGPGRARSMEWAAAVRTNADSLRNPSRLLLGAYDSGIPATLEGVLRVERALGVTLPLIQAYTAWGDRADQRLPLRLAEAIADLGSVPVITWEPWLADFENRLHPNLPLRHERDRGSLAAIAGGSYDFYIDEWARDAARFGRPLMVRFAHEMNDPYRYPWGPQNNSAEDFIRAWQHVVTRFRDAGASNVVWVWSPHVAYAGYEQFYPGDEFVDWVATGALNYGTVAYWSQWWTFDEIFGQRYPALAALGKPIMIAEFGSLSVGGERGEWYASALENFEGRFPLVRALVFFHVEADRTVTYQALDWSFLADSGAVRSIRSSLDN